MRLRTELLYNELQNDLRLCKDKGLPFQVETECCFRISEEYWNLLREDIRRYGMPSIADEIFFFKEVKPKFVSESEYYRLINYAANFCPDDVFPHDQKTFWVRQLNRLDKFRLQNEDFCIYYAANLTSKDEIYFTRGDINFPDYSFDKAASGFDDLIGQLLARQRYAMYARDKLKVCLLNL